MQRIAFSPLEESVLGLIGARWWTLEELQRELFPEIAPEGVKSAVAYLRRQNLVQPLDRPHGTQLYEQTELGCQVLAEHRRARMGELYVA